MGHRGLSQRGQRGRSITLTEKRGSTGDLFNMTWDGGLLDGVFIHNNTFFWNPPVERPPVKMTETEFGGSRSNSVINNVIYSTVPSIIHQALE